MSNTFSISKNKIISLAIGGFDGIHLAHQELIKRLDKNGALFIVDRFNSTALTPDRYRCRYTKKPCFFYKLEDIKNLGCKEFGAFLQKEFPALKKIIVGYDFRYGKDRNCTPNSLKKFFKVEIVSEIKKEGLSVHSKVIKKFIRNGHIKKASLLLGRRHEIEGEVVCGQGLGAKELVPTINLKIEDFLLPKNGVYATQTIINGKVYDSVTFIGHRVSTDGSFAVETHILDKYISCKEDKIRVEFIQRIRDNKKFNSLKELKTEIAKDIKKCKEILNEYKT